MLCRRVPVVGAGGFDRAGQRGGVDAHHVRQIVEIHIGYIGGADQSAPLKFCEIRLAVGRLIAGASAAVRNTGEPAAPPFIGPKNVFPHEAVFAVLI